MPKKTEDDDKIIFRAVYLLKLCPDYWLLMAARYAVPCAYMGTGGTVAIISVARAQYQGPGAQPITTN